MRFETFACERPPRLRRFGGFATFYDAAATPPHEEGNAHRLNNSRIRWQGGECALLWFVRSDDLGWIL